MANFLLPSLKLKKLKLQADLEETLLGKFGGFTVTAGMISGYWIDEQGKSLYGEHQEYKVAIGAQEEELKTYLADLAKKLDEECIYLEVGGETFLIFPNKN